MATFSEYIDAIKNKNISFVLLVEFLDHEEQISKPIYLDIIDESGSIKVTMQNGIRRISNLTLDNRLGKYDIDVSKLWMYQKVKIQIGVNFINKQGKEDMYLISQGVYYITNPTEVYSPNNKVINFELADKWVRLDGRMGGYLDATYSFPKNYTDSEGVKHKCEYDMYNIIKNILNIPLRNDIRNIAFIDKIESTNVNTAINKFLDDNGYDLFSLKENEAVTDNSNGKIYFIDNTPSALGNVYPTWVLLEGQGYQVVDHIEPLLSNFFYQDSIFGDDLIKAPYTITKKMGETYADIFLEISKILGAEIYYDRIGRLQFTPTQESSGNLKDSNKEVAWSFNENDGVLYDLPSETYDFEKTYNYIVLKGTITDIGSYVVSAQNNDPKSPTSIGRIGTKTITYNNGALYDPKLFMEKLEISEVEAIDMCKKLLKDHAKHLLKKHTLVQTRSSIKCFPLPHLDVGNIVKITKENGTTNKYIITSINMPLDFTTPMSLEVSLAFDIDITTTS